MYCEKCKKNARLGEAYCTECGSKLVERKIDFKLSKKVKNSILATIITFIILFLMYMTANYLLSPEYAANKYFKSLVDGDIDEIYSYIDYDSIFVSKEILEEKMDSLADVSDYEIVKVQISEKEALVQIKYNIYDEENTVYVALKRNKGKYLLFDEYQVESGKVVSNITIKVPASSSITVDDKDIQEYLTDDDNEYFDVYKIPYMVKGKYTVKTSLNGITVEDEIEVSSNQTYSINNIEIEDEQEESLKTTALEKINLIYNSALNDKTFAEIKSNFQIGDYDTLEDTYKEIRRSFNTSYLTVNSIEFKELSIKRVAYSNEGKLMVTFDVDYTVNGVIKLQEEKSFTSKENSYIKVTFDYVNGTYDVYDISGELSVKGWQ